MEYLNLIPHTKTSLRKTKKSRKHEDWARPKKKQPGHDSKTVKDAVNFSIHVNS